VELAKGGVSDPQVSPDGRFVAYYRYEDSQGKPISRVEVVPVGGGSLGQFLDLPTGVTVLRWTPEGHAIGYLRTVGSVTNLWVKCSPKFRQVAKV